MLALSDEALAGRLAAEREQNREKVAAANEKLQAQLNAS